MIYIVTPSLAYGNCEELTLFQSCPSPHVALSVIEQGGRALVGDRYQAVEVLRLLGSPHPSDTVSNALAADPEESVF